MINKDALKILIVDDSEMMIETIYNAFIENGIDGKNIKSAASAAEAIDMLNQEEFIPDLITMDINMPEMDGIEATQIISKEHEDIDIIMVTTKGEENSVIKAMSCGAKGYFLKPVSKEQIEEMLNYLNMLNELI